SGLLDSLSSKSLRARSSGSFIPSKRREALMVRVVYSMLAAVAAADSASVSSVMKFSLTHSARLACTVTFLSSTSASLKKASASARVGAAWLLAAVEAPAVVAVGEGWGARASSLHPATPRTSAAMAMGTKEMRENRRMAGAPARGGSALLLHGGARARENRG